MIDLITAPLQYPFMNRGFIAAALMGIICAPMGAYLVLRGMAFLGSAVAHSILPGVAVGYLTSGGSRKAVFWWALGAAVITAMGIGNISQNSRVKEDTATGIVFAGMFALGIALISSVRDYAADLTHFLFGNILAVSNNDLVVMSVFGVILTVLNIIFYKEFMVLAFDPILAGTLRLPVRMLNNLMFLMLAAVIVVSLQCVGIALMAALLITPAATAYLLTQKLWQMMALGAVIAILSGLSGLYISYYAAISSGAAIVLTATIVFVLVWGGQEIRRRITGISA